jgi:hypothetical protein
MEPTPRPALPPSADDDTLHFELLVQPETHATAWHAALQPLGGGARVEFDTPLALARFLAQFLNPRSPSRGLR